ncbi:iron-siderophore ABC transporter permease [Afifella marina DSM 2698]|nr:iron-siderophore ABC transporter permease [Afifella marina DSM 2698]MBK1627708.1 iron-siderophore ABC transporter permease [Afifella marina]MBK5916432.1 iron-siderophore ABC transporter permease [Afifella marina]RAI20984.1 iron-siderophore ABC transporter permease [Afifella marina DSM 2698]
MTATSEARAADVSSASEGMMQRHYRALVARRLMVLFGLSAVLLVCLVCDIALGPASYSFGEVVSALVRPDAVSAQLKVIVWDIRLPVAMMAVVAGAALSVAGAQMQTILANPLASPFTLGISAAAGFGASLALVVGVALVPVAGDWMVPGNAFVMAILAALFIHFASTMRGVTVETMILLGIALVFTFNALMALLQYTASEQALAAVVFWTMGSLTKSTWSSVGITAAVLVVTLPLFMRHSWALTALRLGDDKAASFGVNVRRLRLETMLTVSLLAAVPVAFVGTIGFVGLVGPHIARMLMGEDQRFFLPGAMLCGAVILSLASIISKLVVPGAVLPIGIITALVGVPFFFSLIFTSRGRSW